MTVSFKLRQKVWVVLLSILSAHTSCTNSKEPNFADDIAPIVYKNCTVCHKPNGGAPFNLITYQDVAKRAKMVSHVTRTKYMPPWPADKTYSSFVNEKGLSDEEIETIEAWYKAGKPSGDTSKLVFNLDAEQSILGKPDLVLDLTPVQIQDNNRDRFYVMKIPYQIPEAKYVRAVEFVPGQSKYAHHMNGHYLRYSEDTDPFAGKTLIDIESDNYVQEFDELSMLNADGSIPQRVHSAVNYLPGAFGVRYPDGIGGFLLSKKGAFVANDIHYGPSRESVIDSSKLFIYFSKTPPKRPTFELMMGTNGVSEIFPPLQVKANTISKHRSELVIMSDISVLTINPHMHLIGKTFKAYAIKPNADTVKLIYIPEWQFLWQYFYTFKSPVRIPKGSRIVVEASFDNTMKNPFNPNNPPKDIGERLDRGGASMRTTDEMLQFIITYMNYKEGDEQINLDN
jgi:hypothetical protein